MLLPVCVGMGRALFGLIGLAGMPDTTFAPLMAGVGCMFLIYHWVPKPMWIYVFGHEFTHAAATMAFGGRVTGLKVTSDGGHVLVTNTCPPSEVTFRPVTRPPKAMVAAAGVNAWPNT